jgi:hypothetical protein|tara:strand:- start:3695 stop:4129 length:435 start_codon:yes stop_codon:yes gene_type:complete
MIRPIQTEYDGHRFRSRLEARWAVFFNEMGWVYHYEAEGYTFVYQGEVVKGYLPDFFVPKLDAFVEVKGPLMTEVETFKLCGLCENHDKNGYAFREIPKEHGDNKFASEKVYGPILRTHIFKYDGINKALDKARKARFEYGEKG